MFELESTPNFGNEGWVHAKFFLEVRNGLMHPKKISNFEVSDGLWEDVRKGISWLLEQFFKFIELLQNKYARAKSCA